MALPWVLVDRNVRFIDEEGSSSREGKEAAAIGGSGGALSPQEAMAAMKPNPVTIAPPPEVSRLSMLRRTPADNLGFDVYDGEISSTHQGLVLLYTGCYRPGSGGYSVDGCYLLYDASNNAVSTIPPVPDSPGIKCLGRTGVILRQGTGGDYCIAELVTTFDPGFPEADFYLWSGSSTVSTGGQWIKTPVQLPLPAPLCGPDHLFNVDMAFELSSSQLCWVDLLTGILVCNLLVPQGPEFSFIPLPRGYELYLPENQRLRLNAEEFRSMSCVHGAIKFAAMVDITNPRVSPEEVTLKTWTLSPDFRTWVAGKSWCVGEIWASDSFRRMELPHLMLKCPVLSMDSDEVHAILNDVDYVKCVAEFGETVFWDEVPKAHYRIQFDMMQNKVVKCTKISKGDLLLLEPTLLASDFSAHLQGLRTARERKRKAKLGADKKRKY